MAWVANWLGVLPVFIIALLIILVPGALLAWGLRLRGLAFVAAQLAGSFAVIAVTAILVALVGVSWSVWPVLALAIILGAALRLITKKGEHTVKPKFVLRHAFYKSAGAILAFLLIASQVARAISSPENMSQTFDAVFHLNAVAQILQTGSASPFDLDLTSSGEGFVFYPALWHGTVALIVQLTGTTVIVATNVLALIVASVVWPVAIIFLFNVLFGASVKSNILVGVLAASFTAYPYLLLTWGVLYPNLLSNAILPVVLAFLVLGLKQADVRSQSGVGSVAVWIAFLGSLGAATLAHPNALFGTAILIAPLLIVTFFETFKFKNTFGKGEFQKPTFFLKQVALIAALLAYIPLWLLLSTGERRSYDAGIVKAFGSAISNSPLVDARSWFLTVLVLIGAVLLWRLKIQTWLIFSYALSVIFYVLVLGVDGPVRDMITGPWYSDAARLASLMPIPAVLIAGFGVKELCKIFERSTVKLDKLTAGMINVLLLLLLIVGAKGNAIGMQVGWLAGLHETQNDMLLLSEDETALLLRIDDEIDAAGVIAGDPWTGSALAFAISGHEVLFPHLQGFFSKDSLHLASQFNEMERAEACQLLNELNISHMLSFGGERYNGGGKLAEKFDGIRELHESDILTEIDREGEAALFAVTCD